MNCIKIIAASLLFLLPFNGFSQTTSPENAELPDMIRTADSQVKALIEQARNGVPEAYRELMERSCDGRGIKQSYFNMLGYHSIYNDVQNYQKRNQQDSINTNIDSEQGIKEFINTFDESHPFRTICDLMDLMEKEEPLSSYKLDILYDQSPVEAKAFYIVKEFNEEGDTLGFLHQLDKAEKAGSQSASIIKLYHYQKVFKLSHDECMQAMEHAAQRIPFLNNELGRVYGRMYEVQKDINLLKKSIKAYQKAERCGMLKPRYARRLLAIYKAYANKGITCSPEEMERLKKISRYY